MKGTKKIEISGEQITLRFTTGVIEDIQEYQEQNDLSEQDLDKMKHMRVMFALMELYATEDEWKDPDILDKAKEASFKFKNVDASQLGELMSIVNEVTEQVGNVQTPKEKK